MNASGCSLDLFGHHVIAILFMSRSIWAHYDYFMSLYT